MGGMGAIGGMPNGMNMIGMNDNGAKGGSLDQNTMLAMMAASGQGGNMAQMLAMQKVMGANNDGTSSNTADMIGKLSLLGHGLGIGNANPTTCQADYKMDCMVSPDTEKLSFSDLIKLREKCMIKGCCWDQAKASQMTYQKNFDGISDLLTRASCPYNVPVSLGGLPDLTDDMRGCCDFSPCVHTQPPADWSTWGEWSECNVPCGGGVSMRSRFCSGHGFCPGMADDGSNEQVSQLSCNTQMCEAWAEWSTWGQCFDANGVYATCGHANQKRSRSCWSSRENMEVSSASAPGCQGPDVQDSTCNLPRCPEWMPWAPWSACSSSCGIGRKARNRKCTYPGQCAGDTIEYVTCGNSCWSEWTNWSSCSRTCMGGQQGRSRTCLYINETSLQCVGSADEVQECASNYCEVWQSWAPWSQCVGNPSQTCGAGKRSRSRACTGNVGAPGCQGAPNVSEICSMGTCSWSEWSVASTCDTARGCGRGKATYQRTCPTFGGCAGSATKTDDCELELCPGFSEWADWSACSATCGQGLRTRTRSCNGVMHQDCFGSASHREACESNTPCGRGTGSSAATGWGSSSGNTGAWGSSGGNTGAWGSSGGNTGGWGSQQNNPWAQPATNTYQQPTNTYPQTSGTASNNNMFGGLFGNMFGTNSNGLFGQTANTDNLYTGGSTANNNPFSYIMGRKKK